ncbi:DUF4390 domain-containing protein [Granulosicoccus antarcticus]|uniref:DUF4390 domain-containing protein n=1 Tax=Granulosicoccus antarcticus IMCC3135 TaxID=1192854 RepID=A0A2Z2NJI1_9GAMM|nr:DUF4390 domain-containing protein [Granulosicoccus antarcticus]ASJ71466.1 hypothetical protein IMCC3135_06795 [Granulosicoccus antarcticus IMCC3135]
MAWTAFSTHPLASVQDDQRLVDAEPDKGGWALAFLLVPLLTLLVFIVLVSISARSLSLSGATDGSIKLADVELQRESGQLYLSATADIDLPEPIRDGLDSGVPLDFILTLAFSQSRDYWFDRSLAQYQHRFRLTYYELTRHYRVHAIDTGISRNYRSLYAAIEGLGTFKRLPMALDVEDVMHKINVQVLEQIPSRVVAQLQFKLDSDSLPLPLQPLIASSWRLTSKEYQWQVN